MLDLYSMSADPNPRTILRIEVVLRRSGLKRTMLYDLIAKGQFPKQVSLGARAVGWYEDEVNEWVRELDSAKRHLERPGHIVAGGTEMPPAKRPSNKTAGGTTALHPAQSKRSAAMATPPSAPLTTVGTAAAGPKPKPGIYMDTDGPQAMTKSEELIFLRKENGQLKKLVGELVLKNSLLQSSVGLKAFSL